jgi:hypothetical protein
VKGGGQAGEETGDKGNPERKRRRGGEWVAGLGLNPQGVWLGLGARRERIELVSHNPKLLYKRTLF